MSAFLDDEPAANPTPPPPTSDREFVAAAAEPALIYSTADLWLREWMLFNWRPSAHENAYRWCAEWWLHPEAINRIEALWRSWEQCRTEGLTGPSTWWRDHFDHHWPLLIAADGPFAGCKEGRHQQAAGLTANRMPLELRDYL